MELVVKLTEGSSHFKFDETARWLPTGGKPGSVSRRRVAQPLKAACVIGSNSRTRGKLLALGRYYGY